MKDLINLQLFRVSVSFGVLISLLYFMAIAPSLKNAKGKNSTDTACDVPATDDKAIEDIEEVKTTIKSIKKSARSKRNKLATLLTILKSILEEELKCYQTQETKADVVDPIKEIPEIEQRIENYNETIDETVCKGAVNKSFDCNKILERISAALERSRVFSKEKKPKEPANIMPIFKKTPEDSLKSLDGSIKTLPKRQSLQSPSLLKDMPPIPMTNLVGKLNSNNAQVPQSYINPVPNTQKFIIPCQRTSDILDDSYLIPKKAYCNSKNINSNTILKPVVKATEYNSLRVNTTPKAVSCKEADGTVAMLFKPTEVSLMQVYGNLLKKLTVTVLVPYYVSKLGF
ncbi:hypothetical protein K1T71_014202 [Dendrolimus kikuchii]|uniref:Uncharacterized protein n=1 Tax=Dendrolimus kikuchii TaxID=765133 RepID=A0ACC1CFM3_9NEOP|nr:hypothetical protein K1T71_014202 [Dendrolimus kikuchii]